MRHLHNAHRHALSIGALLMAVLTASTAAQTTYIDTFESGTSQGGWTFGGPGESIALMGGNPGRYLRSVGLDTFAPQPRTRRGLASIFTGDFRDRGVTELGVDLITTYVDFSAAERPLSLLLIDDNGTPFDSSDDWAAYVVGPVDVPQPGEGWRSFRFTVPSDATALPPGWGTLAFGPSSPANPDWNRLITGVDQVLFFYGDPEFFFIFQVWDVGLDNARITYGPAGRLADMNCDGRVDFDDIDGFVLAVIGQGVYESAYPDCRWLNGDINGDGIVDFDDIGRFVDCVILGGCP